MAIPKLIHRQWFGPRPMPDRYHENRDLWKRFNPDWRITDFLSLEALPEMRNGEYVHGCGITWHPGRGDQKEASLIQVTQADIAAYELLYRYGGLYVNCDMRPLQPLPDLIREYDLVLAYEIDDVLISNAFMACTPEHPLMDEIIKALPANIETVHAGVDYISGPRFLTRIVKEFAPDAFILPARFCNPWLPSQPRTVYPETICEHEWGHATSDQDLWPDQDRQPGAQRYF